MSIVGLVVHGHGLSTSGSCVARLRADPAAVLPGSSGAPGAGRHVCRLPSRQEIASAGGCIRPRKHRAANAAVLSFSSGALNGAGGSSNTARPSYTLHF